MDIMLLMNYQRYLPKLVPTKDGYWKAPCPWCGGQLEVGLRNLETGEPTDWICTGCGQGGIPEEFFSAMEGHLPREGFHQPKESMPGDVELGQKSDDAVPGDVALEQEGGLSQFGIVEKPEFEGFSQPEGENFPEIEEGGPEQPEVSSHLRIPWEILPFLTLDLPTRELQILLCLQIRGSGISAKEIGEELQIPQSNIHRYLSGLEEKRLIFSEGKPKRYFKIDDARLMGRFRRRLQRQI